MRPVTHYDPDRVQVPTAEKVTVFLQFSLAAAHGWSVEHMDIVNSYSHEPSMHTWPIYAKQMAYSTGRYHKYTITCRFLRNLWAVKSAGPDYVQALSQFLHKLSYEQSNMDPCMFDLATSEETILLAITVDYFFILSEKLTVIDRFYRTLASKYQLERLSRPNKFLGCTVQYIHDGSINLRHPVLLQITIFNANIANSNGRQSPFTFNTELLPQIPTDGSISRIPDFYRQFLGDLRYLSDSTGPYVHSSQPN